MKALDFDTSYTPKTPYMYYMCRTTGHIQRCAEY